MAAEIVIAEKEAKNRFRNEIDGEEYELRKRLPARWPKKNTDVFVSQKTNFKAQLSRCSKLLNSGHNEISIHGLGLAIDRAINIALQLKAKGLGTIEVSATTETVELTDDLSAVNDELDDRTQTRNTSAIHIKVFKIDSTATNQQAFYSKLKSLVFKNSYPKPSNPPPILDAIYLGSCYASSLHGNKNLTSLNITI